MSIPVVIKTKTITPTSIPSISLYTFSNPSINLIILSSVFIGSEKAINILYKNTITRIFITGIPTINNTDIIDTIPPTFPISSVAPSTVFKLSDKNFPTSGTALDILCWGVLN